MFQNLNIERVINKNKTDFGRVVCLLTLNNVKICKNLSVISEGGKNE